MKIMFGLLCVVLILSACSGVGIRKYDEGKNPYLKTKRDTVNMSEYDRQRYYDQNGMGLIEPYDQKIPRR